MDPSKARFQRNQQRKFQFNKSNFTDKFDDNIENSEDDDDVVKQTEEEQKMIKIQKQVNYFGYIMEPLNMKNERDQGFINKDGFYQFDKREDEARDAWLDSLDQNPYSNYKSIIDKKQYQGVLSDQENNSEEDEDIGNSQDKKQDNDQDQEIDNQNQKKEQQNVDNRNDYQEPNLRKKIKIDQNELQIQEVKKITEMSVPSLKRKLCDLLQDQQTPGQALKSFQEKLKGPQIQKQNFKKNVRKIKDQNQQQQPTNNNISNNISQSDEKLQEIQISFNKIVELCTIIINQTANPDLYTQTKQEILKEIEEISTEQKKYEKINFDNDSKKDDYQQLNEQNSKQEKNLNVEENTEQTVKIVNKNTNEDDEDNIF